jgi:hypothetical protein
MTDGPLSTAQNLSFPQILSLQFLFRALFSMKSNWAFGCIGRDRYPDERNTVQHTRDCDVGQMA